MATHTTLASLFSDIADSIRAKKGTSETIVADDFPNEIASIPTGGGADLSEYFNMTPSASEMANTNGWVNNNYILKTAPILTVPDGITNLSYFCSGFKAHSIPKIIFNDKVTNISYMFENCTNAEEIDVTGFDTKNVTTMNYLFSGCANVKEIDISSFDISKVVSNMRYCFYGCNMLEKVIIPATINAPLRDCFNQCYSLKKLIILKTSAVITWNNTFISCYHMDGTVDATWNPDGLKDGRIYVPDTLIDDYKSATGWSTYADQILPLSQLPEDE